MSVVNVSRQLPLNFHVGLCRVKFSLFFYNEDFCFTMKDNTEITNVLPKLTNIKSSVLDAFDLLKSPKEDERVGGGAKIISILRESEVCYYILFIF